MMDQIDSNDYDYNDELSVLTKMIEWEVFGSG